MFLHSNHGANIKPYACTHCNKINTMLIFNGVQRYHKFLSIDAKLICSITYENKFSIRWCFIQSRVIMSFCFLFIYLFIWLQSITNSKSSWWFCRWYHSNVGITSVLIRWILHFFFAMNNSLIKSNYYTCIKCQLEEMYIFKQGCLLCFHSHFLHYFFLQIELMFSHYK